MGNADGPGVCHHGAAQGGGRHDDGLLGLLLAPASPRRLVDHEHHVNRVLLATGEPRWRRQRQTSPCGQAPEALLRHARQRLARQRGLLHSSSPASAASEVVQSTWLVAAAATPAVPPRYRPLLLPPPPCMHQPAAVRKQRQPAGTFASCSRWCWWSPSSPLAQPRAAAAATPVIIQDTPTHVTVSISPRY